jgi:hypothetical protein
LWLKFSLAVLGGILIVHFAFTKMHEVMLVRGFLFGSLLSVVVGLLTLEQGDGFFLQSSGLGRTTTTFGMICSFSISLTFFTEIRLKFQTQVILIFAMTVGTLISGSRGAALTACAALLLILAWNGRESRVFLLTWLLCVSVLGLYLYGFQLLERIGVRAFTANRSTFQSNVIREQLRQQAILDWQYDPIAGVGFSVITQGHSTYLQTLAAGGLILFVTYLILDLKSFSIALECISHRNHVYRLGIVFCIIFNHFTQNQIDVPFLYLILGIVYYAKRVDVSRTFTQGRSGYV